MKRANDALREKLKDPVFAEKHWAKIFAQTKIGYQSRGHKSLHGFLEKYGFESHVQIGSMPVDECHNGLKIVVEYNGDMWHCNPKKWRKDDYNSAIKMTAGKKWESDIARHEFLRSLGYYTLVVWESDWLDDQKKCLEIIERIYHERISALQIPKDRTV